MPIPDNDCTSDTFKQAFGDPNKCKSFLGSLAIAQVDLFLPSKDKEEEIINKHVS
jgi:hypothetical protein